MANTPKSIEVQIDNFLEHFKRSASKAMDGDWVTHATPSSSRPPSVSSPSSGNGAAGEIHSNPLIAALKNRSSCFDISQLSGKYNKCARLCVCDLWLLHTTTDIIVADAGAIFCSFENWEYNIVKNWIVIGWNCAGVNHTSSRIQFANALNHFRVTSSCVQLTKLMNRCDLCSNGN